MSKFQQMTRWVRDTEPTTETEQASPEATIRADENRPAFLGQRPGAVARSPFAQPNPKEDR